VSGIFSGVKLMPRTLSAIRYQPAPSAAGSPPHLTVASTQKLCSSFLHAQKRMQAQKQNNIFFIGVFKVDTAKRKNVA
jgi:hypothetical protein